MTNDRIHRSAKRRKHRAMHAIFAALIMVSGSTAVVHAREVPKYAEIQPGHGNGQLLRLVRRGPRLLFERRRLRHQRCPPLGRSTVQLRKSQCFAT